ncbi:MAG TPA: aminomethyl-transferring glycine dehydrogenase subunit GcvPA [Deltaproteobacteria bacterium]|nr:MAG: glycine dehydrogenase (aminomethyl-transferring) [Deltaproteobacteria bacterium GWA2_55_82]OGQ64277.1 MAG: glycine dehydrogenase (aminomethyl-transferring) [Deltaproteobacteria bacterium RIFCSPLOWO2_02_FULL_55_12]OIJ73979.1 MAG: glycine dehydrogenase (aminomethyl-transferring) [Deltaproteobacteria bacterium GWC2_55_46]HBG46580.1 aminomethyl-transferring glycine dehydrogenase subunit GcvPA [Deltaproteobacteria bacterium]HCY09982.1 aminomethyl-transferring glycine dehydrogenase subunit Gc
MPYIPHTEEDIQKILQAVGATRVEEILSQLPAALRLKTPLDLPRGLSEQELLCHLKDLSAKNTTVEEYSSFLGAGAYNHYIPAIVDSIISRSEFYTSYTPYQPELSQGTLQAIFEYQTLVCQLTGMDVSNASLYDGASAVAEAALMARRITGKDGIILSSSLHPEYRETVKTYLAGTGDSLSEVMYCTETGATLPGAVEAAMVDSTACVVVQHPNFFGCVEDVEALSEVVHRKKAILIVVVNEAVSLGLLKPPGESGCDIVVGENQSFGNPLSYGGPYLGFMATKTEFVRQMPGRIIGQTVDRDGKRAFCLTFATREQHIRRERATSNICTNHGLSALAASVHMVGLGSQGLQRLARLNLSKAEYLKDKITGAGAEIAFTSPTFNEFTVKVGKDPDSVLNALLRKKIIGGVVLKRFYPSLDRHILVAATEMNSKDEMDRFAQVLKGA